jgi:hypothetical protein
MQQNPNTKNPIVPMSDHYASRMMQLSMYEVTLDNLRSTVEQADGQKEVCKRGV